MFTNYEKRLVETNGVHIACRIGGKGPALLLLHGHPQTHVIWHRVADTLAEHFTVVAADLRGYGDSDKPDAQQLTYSKREMASDQVGLMRKLGFDRFVVMAHDRGARVAHRMAADHADAILRMALLDIAPTLAMYEQTDETFARAYWHWFFLIRPAPLPETLIHADPVGYLRSVMGTRHAGMAAFTDEAFAEYLRCLRLPGTATGICEDYRASAGIDLVHDREDRSLGKRLPMPLKIFWGEHGVVGRCFDPLAEWRRVADHVSGGALSCGHYIAEEAPQALIAATLDFLQGNNGDVGSSLS